MHARAAGKIVELARQYKSKVVLKKMVGRQMELAFCQFSRLHVPWGAKSRPL